MIVPILAPLLLNRQKAFGEAISIKISPSPPPHPLLLEPGCRDHKESIPSTAYLALPIPPSPNEAQHSSFPLICITPCKLYVYHLLRGNISGLESCSVSPLAWCKNRSKTIKGYVFGVIHAKRMPLDISAVFKQPKAPWSRTCHSMIQSGTGQKTCC